MARSKLELRQMVEAAEKAAASQGIPAHPDVIFGAERVESALRTLDYPSPEDVSAEFEKLERPCRISSDLYILGIYASEITRPDEVSTLEWVESCRLAVKLADSTSGTVDYV